MWLILKHFYLKVWFFESKLQNIFQNYQEFILNKKPNYLLIPLLLLKKMGNKQS